MRRVREWYLEPLNQHAREVFAREIDSQIEPSEKKVFQSRKPVRVWQCSESQRDFYVKSVGTSELQFKVWTAFEGELLRLWKIDSKKRAEASKVRRRVEAIKQGKKVPKLMAGKES